MEEREADRSERQQTSSLYGSLACTAREDLPGPFDGPKGKRRPRERRIWATGLGFLYDFPIKTNIPPRTKP